MSDSMDSSNGANPEAALREHQALIAVEFDPRLADVWLSVFASGVDLKAMGEQIGCFLRMAYLRGYQDGLTEPESGVLFTKLGLPVPVRQASAKKKGVRA